MGFNEQAGKIFSMIKLRTCYQPLRELGAVARELHGSLAAAICLDVRFFIWRTARLWIVSVRLARWLSCFPRLKPIVLMQDRMISECHGILTLAPLRDLGSCCSSLLATHCRSCNSMAVCNKRARLQGKLIVGVWQGKLYGLRGIDRTKASDCCLEDLERGRGRRKQNHSTCITRDKRTQHERWRSGLDTFLSKL